MIRRASEETGRDAAGLVLARCMNMLPSMPKMTNF